MTLSLRVQPDNYTCTVTCIAMLLNVSPLTLIKEFHTPYLKGQLDIKTYLTYKGISADYCIVSDRLNKDGIYLVCVASLNVMAGLHNVVVERVNGKNTVYDPNKGRNNKRYYTTNKLDESEQAHLFGQYTLDLKIKL